jgi:hypothetical protein
MILSNVEIHRALDEGRLVLDPQTNLLERHDTGAFRARYRPKNAAP